MNRRKVLKTFGTGIAGIGMSPILNAQSDMKRESNNLKGSSK